MSKEKPRYNEIIFSDEEEKKIIKMYTVDNLSTVKIANVFGCSHHTIAKVLKYHNIDRTGLSRRKYGINENYFDSIDTPEKAYILGFLFADGSNNPKKQTVSMSLQEEDFDILEKIRLEIGSKKPLEYLDYSNKHDFGYTYKNQYRLLLFSKKISSRLSSLGMIPSKSLFLKYPDIPSNLHRHFIRGYFDGDGSLYQYVINSNNKKVTVTITSTEDFCLSVKSIIEKELSIYCGIYDASCHNGITKVLTISGKTSFSFLDWIYKDASIYMDRKYLRYLQYSK